MICSFCFKDASDEHTHSMEEVKDRIKINQLNVTNPQLLYYKKEQLRMTEEQQWQDFKYMNGGKMSDKDLRVMFDELKGAANTKAKKFDNGKAPITLIPSEFLLGTASVFAFGAKKYGAHNYRLGLAHSRCIDAAMRHLLAIAAGEEIDPESGLPHVYHASCSLAMYDYSRIHHPELNDIHELIKGKDGAYAISKSTTVNPTSSPQLDSTKPTDNRS